MIYELYYPNHLRKLVKRPKKGFLAWFWRLFKSDRGYEWVAELSLPMHPSCKCVLIPYSEVKEVSSNE